MNINWVDQTESHRFIIEEKVERVCFGSPGRINEWFIWRAFDSAKERDQVLARLRENSPSNIYRARDYIPLENRRVSM